MQEDGAGAPRESDRYRKLASDLRALVPTFKDPQVVEDLGALAACYESLAQHHEGMRKPAGSQPNREGVLE
jgi:hypothetical protein